MPRFRIDQYISIAVLSLVLLAPRAIAAPTPRVPQLELLPVAPVPLSLIDTAEQTSFLATVSAKSIVVVDLPSASILLDKNANQYVSPASTTKLMTALVARQIYDLDERLTVREEAFTVGHIVGLPVGYQFTVAELLRALLIDSGNDAAFVLAQHHPDGYQGFVSQMNQMAQELNLTNTSFTNPSGLDAAAHYTTAFDLSILAREVMRDQVLREIVGTKQTIIRDVSGKVAFPLYNTNLLLSRDGVVGVKTGTTDLAGEALITQVQQDGREVLIIILGSDNRYADTEQIIDWIFRQYSWEDYSVS